jgi:regulator of sigma E protease
MFICLTALIISSLVFLHELGHFICALRMGLPVKRFSLGFGPALFSKQIKGVEYRFSLIPLGGYVLLDFEDHNRYLELPLGKRIIFSLGGPVFNLLTTLPMFALLNLLNHGFSLENLFVAPFVQTSLYLTSLAGSLAGLFQSPDQLSGVVGMVSQGSQYVGMGLSKALSFAILINLNLGLFNLLPLPPLDGGRIVLDLMQTINARLTRLYAPITIGSWLLIMGLMVYATGLDVGRLLA